MEENDEEAYSVRTHTCGHRCSDCCMTVVLWCWWCCMGQCWAESATVHPALCVSGQPPCVCECVLRWWCAVAWPVCHLHCWKILGSVQVQLWW